MSQSDDSYALRQRVLEDFADEVTERLRRGDRPRVEDYVRRYPQFTEEITKLFDTISSVRHSRDDDVRGENDLC